MLPAVNRGAGKNIGFPDVCLTPAGMAVVPMPYPNQAAHAMAIGFSPNVFLQGKSALHLASIIPMTSGDEGGTAHPMIKQMGKFTKGSPVVMVNNLPGIHLTCQTTGNNMNNGLGAVLKTGVTNVFYTYAARGATGASSAFTSSADSFAIAMAAGASPARDGAGSRGGEATHSMNPNEVDALAEEVAPAGREAGPPLAWSLEEGGSGFVRIEVFSPDVPARLFVALGLLEGASAGAVVVDVRGNPGGSFSAFVEAASLFLPAGSRIAAFVDEHGDRTEHRSFTERPCPLPLVIVVDGGTASAAELFAECLSAHGRATVVGGPTYGKRTAQRLVPAPDGGAVRAAAGRVEAGVSGGGETLGSPGTSHLTAMFQGGE